MNLIYISLIVYGAIDLIASVILGWLSSFYNQYTDCLYFDFPQLINDTDMNLFGVVMAWILVVLFANFIIVVYLLTNFIYWITHIEIGGK
ncbi:MAG TPA: hypothetical protein PKV66_00815 [Candidatus Pelethenecus sp.]|nr:hypothetical protein [Candidatus Pelethenecus sp.]